MLSKKMLQATEKINKKIGVTVKLPKVTTTKQIKSAYIGAAIGTTAIIVGGIVASKTALIMGSLAIIGSALNYFDAKNE